MPISFFISYPIINACFLSLGFFMNRNICVLSTSKNVPQILVCRFNDGYLMVGETKAIKPKRDDKTNKVTISTERRIAEVLADYQRRGYAVYVDELVPRFSTPYQHSPLIGGDEPLIIEALKCYQDLKNNKKIKFKPPMQEINCVSLSESMVDESGKPVFRVNAEAMRPEQAALLVASYHALNADITDINFLRDLFANRNKARRGY